MKIEVSETVKTTINIDLSTPAYRKMNNALFMKLYEKENTGKSVMIGSGSILIGIFDIDAFHCKNNWEPATEHEFEEAKVKFFN